MGGCYYNRIRHKRFFIARWTYRVRISNGGAGGINIDFVDEVHVCGICKNIIAKERPNTKFERIS